MKSINEVQANKYRLLKVRIDLLKNKISESIELVPNDIKRLAKLEKQYLRKPVVLYPVATA